MLLRSYGQCRRGPERIEQDHRTSSAKGAASSASTRKSQTWMPKAQELQPKVWTSKPAASNSRLPKKADILVGISKYTDGANFLLRNCPRSPLWQISPLFALNVYMVTTAESAASCNSAARVRLKCMMTRPTNISHGEEVLTCVHISVASIVRLPNGTWP